MPQVEQAMRVTNPDYDHWWKGNASQWLPAARYLVMPIAAMAAGLGALFVRHDERSRRMSLTLVGLAWATFVIMSVQTGQRFARGSPLARCTAGVPSSEGAFCRDTRR